MNKIPQLFLIIFLITIYGCKNETPKPKQPPLSPNYKITIVKGDNQADTLNHLLKDTVIVKVTNNGNPYLKGTIRFIVSGCDSDETTDFNTLVGGLAYYNWRLNSTAGKQYLKAVLLDSLNKKVDSVTLTANAAAPQHGWQPVGCIPPSLYNIATLAKLSSGRLLTGFYQNGYPYYSDDNALTWHPLKSFGNTHSVRKIITTPADEIFILTYSEGIFYSPDAGKTWQLRNGNAPFSEPLDLVYTQSGKLFFNVGGALYLSTDKGVNFNFAGGGTYNYINIGEQPNGTDYAINNQRLISNTSGSVWNEVNSAFDFNHYMQSLFIDDNGDIYIGTEYVTAQIYRSKDNGSTWNSVYTEKAANGLEFAITQMQKQNGYYSFYVADQGLVKTKDFTTYTNIKNPFMTGPLDGDWSTYVFANNNALVIGGNEINGIYYYLP